MNDIIEAAKVLQRAGYGSMSAITLLRYLDIYAKYRYYRECEKTTEAVYLTSESAYCSERLVYYVVKMFEKNI